ncbi:unnamed protein product, partial [Ectocarpus sp. 12 AP-2014]
MAGVPFSRSEQEVLHVTESRPKSPTPSYARDHHRTPANAHQAKMRTSRPSRDTAAGAARQCTALQPPPVGTTPLQWKKARSPAVFACSTEDRSTRVETSHATMLRSPTKAPQQLPRTITCCNNR